MTDWFQALDGVVASKELIAREFKRVRDATTHVKAGKPVTEDDVARVVYECRIDMERRYKNTLYCVRNMGYKVCAPQELALYTAKFVKRTIQDADRTYRLLEIVDRRQLPDALRTVFITTETPVKQLSIKGKRFVNEFVAYLRKKREPLHVTDQRAPSAAK